MRGCLVAGFVLFRFVFDKGSHVTRLIGLEVTIAKASLKLLIHLLPPIPKRSDSKFALPLLAAKMFLKNLTACQDYMRKKWGKGKEKERSDGGKEIGREGEKRVGGREGSKDEKKALRTQQKPGRNSNFSFCLCVVWFLYQGAETDREFRTQGPESTLKTELLWGKQRMLRKCRVRDAPALHLQTLGTGFIPTFMAVYTNRLHFLFGESAESSNRSSACRSVLLSLHNSSFAIWVQQY